MRTVPKGDAEFARSLFPEWDREREWKIKVRKNLGHGGLYDRSKKTIFLQSYDPSKMYVLLHEICHHVDRNGHTKRFFARMRRAEKDLLRISRDYEKKGRRLESDCFTYQARELVALSRDCLSFERTARKFSRMTPEKLLAWWERGINKLRSNVPITTRDPKKKRKYLEAIECFDREMKESIEKRMRAKRKAKAV